MTRNASFKRRVRARAARTGEAYTAALRHLRAAPPAVPAGTLRLAVAQTDLVKDPRDAAAIRAAGKQMRRLMTDAAAAGARLVHFPEGTLCWPDKRLLSATGPAEVGPADWSRLDWSLLSEEIGLIRGLARRLSVWTVFGCVHPVPAPEWPRNALHVVADDGRLAARYDERMLSRTKRTFLHSPGRDAVTFEVDGLAFGCALGLETHFPEIFGDYERRDVAAVLFSTSGESPEAAGPFAAEVRGHAAAHRLWIGYAAHAPQSVAEPSGIAGPDGRWHARGPATGAAGLAVADIAAMSDDGARRWRRAARSVIDERQGSALAPRDAGGDIV